MVRWRVGTITLLLGYVHFKQGFTESGVPTPKNFVLVYRNNILNFHYGMMGTVIGLSGVEIKQN